MVKLFPNMLNLLIAVFISCFLNDISKNVAGIIVVLGF